MKTHRLLLGVFLASLLLSACGRHRTASRVPVPPPPSGQAGESAAGPGYVETGYASWYGDPYHGRRAANGEIYDKHQLTAAHLTLPFGTQAKVTNLENRRSVVVRITDRGPFVKGRIIDLSQAGAQQIAMIGPGTALVRLEVLSVGDRAVGRFAVQVGAFRDRSNAERLREDLRRRFGGAFIENYDSGRGLFYRVRVGPKASLSEASRLGLQLGKEKLPGFVVRIDN